MKITTIYKLYKFESFTSYYKIQALFGLARVRESELKPIKLNNVLRCFLEMCNTNIISRYFLFVVSYLPYVYYGPCLEASLNNNCSQRG